MIIDIGGDAGDHARHAGASFTGVHAQPARVRVADETATIGAATLAGADAAVIEVRATVAGALRTVTCCPARSRPPPPSPRGRAPSLPWDERRRGSIGFSGAGRESRVAPGVFVVQSMLCPHSSVALVGVERSPSRPGVGACFRKNAARPCNTSNLSVENSGRGRVSCQET